MQSKPKNISHMFSIVTDPNLWKKYHIGTLVDAANPTLMRTNQGVAGEIHKVFDQYLKKNVIRRNIEKNSNPLYIKIYVQS